MLQNYLISNLLVEFNLGTYIIDVTRQRSRTSN